MKDAGPRGEPGPKGDKGDKGDTGKGLEFSWNGTQLGVRVEGDATYQYVNLKGDKGDDGYTPVKGVDYFDGEQGPKGDKGDKGESAYEHWLSLGNVGTINDFLLTLKGDKGDKGDPGEKGEKGDKGDSIEFAWNGTQLGVRVEGETSYQYVDLKGDKGDKGEQGPQGDPSTVNNIVAVDGNIELTANDIPYDEDTSVKVKIDELRQQINTLDYSTVAAVTDVYTIDFANSPVKNVKIETEDTNAKTVALANVPTGDAELFIELTYTNAAAITWFEGITWLSGFAPTFTEGKVYRIALFKYGTGWHGNCVGGW